MKLLKRHLISILIFLTSLLLMLAGIRTMNVSTRKDQYNSLEKAINTTILECYIQEGHYPENLKEIENEYHLTYDHSLFKVTYKFINEDDYPDVHITIL